MKKRLLASVLCLLMVVFCVVGFTACFGDDKCSHKWGQWTETTSATCTEEGVQERECSECGETETSAISPLGHDWEAATCTAPKTCKTCSTTEGTTNPHAYTVETVKDEALKSAATCAHGDIYYKSCSCGAISTNDADTFTVGEPLSHKDENYDHTCDYGCNTTFGEHADSNTDNDHVCDYGCGAILESCSDAEDDGNHTCDVCGHADVSAHSFGSATCKAPATCSECGATTGTTLQHEDENHDHICDNECGKNDMGTHADSNTDNDHVCDYGCGAVLENCSDVSTDTDHDCDVCGKANVSVHAYVENTALATEATCNTAATKTYECNCGDTYTEEDGDALGHNITDVEPIERQVSGCEYVLVYICQNDHCDNENKEVLGETVHHHKYVASISTPATCSTPGEKTFRCSDCGDTDRLPEEIPADATGHDWENGEVENGVRTDTCSICHETKTVIVSDGNSASSNASNLANADVQLKVDDDTNANIQLGQGVADAIGDKDITISAGVVDEDTLKDMGVSDEQLGQIGGNTVYDFNIKDASGDYISNFGKNNFVTITLPYNFIDGEDVDSIAIWFISDTCQVEDCDKGENCVEAHKLVSIEATYNNGYVTFQTNHFSVYTVTRLTPAQRCALYGHGYAEQVVEGNCTKDGYVLLICVRCHDRKIQEGSFVTATGHDYTATTHDATCTESGYVLYSCNNCDHSYRTRLNATGHAWNVIASNDPSCVADGYVQYCCDNCGAEYTIIYAKLTHVYTNTVVPATCTADGYTLHDCDNCEYSYTDEYVDALGHVYESTTWNWAADYSSATLTFVCANNREHVIVINATIESSSISSVCSDYVKTTYTATVSYGGTDYTDEKIAESGTPGHKFSSEWTKDANGHWRECACGEKTDASKHTFENATTTKNPTCKETGESTSYCVCGETKVSVIPTTGEHNYVDGVCSVCGKEESACDHTELHRESIDFGKLGACEWVLYYDTCECGEVKIIDVEHSEILCDFEEMEDQDMSVDENGNTVISMRGECPYCGMEISFTAIYTEDGCMESYVFNYTFKVDGEVVIDNVGYESTNVWHEDTKQTTIDLSEYDACGGLLYVSKCEDCGEITEIYNYEVDCDVNLKDPPIPEEITDENGVVHYVSKVECPDCGLQLVVDNWTEELSVCETIMHMTITVSCGDTIIVSLEEEHHNDRHEYEYTYETQGETCDDGVKIIAHCDLCGDEYSYINYGHEKGGSSVEIDLSEYSSCGGTIHANCCLVCGCIIDVNDMDIHCDIEDGTMEQIVDENGVTHYITTSTCPDCGLVFATDEWMVQEASCVVRCYESMYVYVDEECIFELIYVWSEADHDYVYTYEPDGETCDDGYKVICYCTVCGENDEWYSSGHRNESFQIDFSELGGCSGILYAERCSVCNEIMYIKDWNVGCELDEPEPVEVVDENGITHYVSTQICPDCGMQFVIDEWETVGSSCVSTEHVLLTVCSGGNVVFAYEQTYENQTHEYEFTYEKQGETCDDGYYVNKYCPNCGESDRYYGSGHQTEWIEIDLAELGLCGGYIEESYCAICDTEFYSSIHDRCYWECIENTDDGNQVFECEYCGATRLITFHESEKDEDCQYTYTETYVFIVDGEEVYRKAHSYTRESHDYKYNFIMNGASCMDGYIVVVTCGDCDMYSTEESYYHNYYDLFNVDNGYDCCDEHYVEVGGCPCGYYYDFKFNEDTFTYDDELSTYVCEDCGLSIAFNHESEEEGCALIELDTIVVTFDEVIYRYEKEVVYANHNFTDIEASLVDGASIITTTCDKCDTVNSAEVFSVQMELHDGSYYYDYAFTPNESATYTIMGLANGDTYVELYKVVDGELVQIDENDDAGHDVQFLLTANLTAGTTYVYRIGYLGFDEEGVIDVMFMQTTSGVNCMHNSYKYFSALLADAESCEDGVLYGSIYTECGCVDAYVSYEHAMTEKERVDLSERGACYGEFVYEECACGQVHDVYLESSCFNTWTSDEYYDEEHRLIHVDVRSCTNCGLRYTSSYYTVKDRTTCTLTYYYTVVINLGVDLIGEVEYTLVEEDHEYAITSTLMGETCADGVVITYKCVDCEYEYSNESYYHYTYEKERVDLSEYGSVCGGYASVYGCACGQRNSLSLDHSLCELGSEWCEMWIEDALTEGQYTINGWNGIWNEARLYICAVTDPVEVACAYKIRYAYYWLKDENSCTAYRYETWQFGYNETTGTYEYEVSFKTDSSMIYHNYVDSSTEHHTRYDCSDCGSYYNIKYTYNEDGVCIKYEQSAFNTLDNGQNKYYERVEEYTTNGDGDWYTNRVYRKDIYADNTEYWYEEFRNEESYTGTFGDGGYKTSSRYTESNGYSRLEEYACVYYKDYAYTIYSYREEGDYWYRYDHTYTFDGECIETQIYTDSDGVREENVYDNCKFYDRVTIKNPTCTQDGEGCSECVICGNRTEFYVLSPHDHNWVQITENWHFCFECGLENANGVSGDIVMEDLTEAYGNGEYYVVGYYTNSEVSFSQYVSLIFADGMEVAIWSGIDFITIDGIRAYAFSKSAVDAWATENGYTDYDVRFSFVPYGSDGSFDYGITFTESTVITGVITSNVSFTDYVGANENKTYTIAPSEDGEWVFTSFVEGDTFAILYDAEGNELASNDDGGNSANFKIVYELKAGETYTLSVRWYHSSSAGDVPLLFGATPVIAE